jgi:hypothetical protein
MIVLDDPANPFSLIFSIRKIPNDLLDLERLNRPGESVPSRESRTSTLKGLFLLEGPAAALCIRTADFRCWHETDMPTASRNVGFRGQSGKHVLALSFSGFDPACVKTRASKECAELFSPFSSFDCDCDCQCCSFPIQRNRDEISTRKFDVGVFTQAGPISDLAPLLGRRNHNNSA